MNLLIEPALLRPLTETEIAIMRAQLESISQHGLAFVITDSGRVRRLAQVRYDDDCYPIMDKVDWRQEGF